MFEFSRELRRILQPRPPFATPRDGLTGGDAELLELLDLNLLAAEAKASDIAAGRISAKDRPMLHLQQAVVWRELARRTGDGVSLRKAASAAELSLNGVERSARPQVWARARAEQGLCAILGAELFGDEGLRAAAGVALAEAARVGAAGSAGALAEGARAQVAGAEALASGDQQAVLAAAALYDAPLTRLDGMAREKGGRAQAARLRADRAEMLIGAGARLQDEPLLRRAANDLVRALSSLDPAHEPLSWARLSVLRGECLIVLGEVLGAPERIGEGIEIIAGAFDYLGRDHSPLDWARAQLVMAQGLECLAELGESQEAYDQAIGAYDRALHVLKGQPALRLRAVASVNRALCLSRRAELCLDLFSLDGAEAGFRCELAAADPAREPVAWAVCQMGLARIYEARADITGRDNGERARAALALSAALDVFGEQGMRSLADVALSALERLKTAARQ